MNNRASMKACIVQQLLILLQISELTSGFDPLRLLRQEVIIPQANEVAIKFRAQIKNDAPTVITNVVLQPERCCFYRDKSRNCQVFPPVGEKLDYLEPGAQYNLTMLYVNFYVLQRYGECNATLSHDASFSQRVTFGTFNTTLGKSYQWLPSSFQGWLSGSRSCATYDQDVAMNCKPVNCMYKYGGLKNLFDESKQICKRPHACFSDPKSSMPMQGLDMDSNSCKDLSVNLTADEMAFFYKMNEGFMNNNYNVKKVGEVICVHGRLRPDNRSCTCDYGWSSNPHDHSPYDPITQVYYLCNTQTFPPSNSGLRKVTTHLIKIVIFLVCLVIVACAASFVFFCCASLYMVYRGKRQEKINVSNWFRDKMGKAEDVRQPLMGTAVLNMSTNANVQHIETSWYNTEDSIHDIAVVHTRNKGKKVGELYLNPDDVITDLEKVDIPGYWKGTCRDKRGIFPSICAEFRREGQRPTPLPKFSR